MTPPEFEALRWELAGGVEAITLDRPDALNSLERRLKADLLAAFRQAEPLLPAGPSRSGAPTVRPSDPHEGD